jgi:acyl-CoA hydrolase
MRCMVHRFRVSPSEPVNLQNSVTADEAISSLLVRNHSLRDIALYNLTLRQRAEALIGVAHPDFRAKLRQSFADARCVVLGAGR